MALYLFLILLLTGQDFFYQRRTERPRIHIMDWTIDGGEWTNYIVVWYRYRNLSDYCVPLQN